MKEDTYSLVDVPSVMGGPETRYFTIHHTGLRNRSTKRVLYKFHETNYFLRSFGYTAPFKIPYMQILYGTLAIELTKKKSRTSPSKVTLILWHRMAGISCDQNFICIFLLSFG